VSNIGRPVEKALVISEGGRLTSDGFSFFFSTAACQKERDPSMRPTRDIPFPLSESQLPSFLTTGRFPLTSGFSFGDVMSSRSSNRLPRSLLSRAFCAGAGADAIVLACARVKIGLGCMRTLATRGAVWSHIDSYVAEYVMDVKKGCVTVRTRG